MKTYRPTSHSSFLRRQMSKWFFAALAGATFLLQSIGHAQAAAVYNTSVPCTAPWFDTGLYIDSGTYLDIQSSGSVVYGPLAQQVTGPGGTNYDGRQFFLTAVLPNTTVVSLIGKIGGTTTIGTGTLVPGGLAGNGGGYVGISYHQFIATGGELFLGFNDQVNAFSDNSGSFNVTVTVPEPSSAALAGIGAVVFIAGFVKRKNSSAKI